MSEIISIAKFRQLNLYNLAHDNGLDINSDGQCYRLKRKALAVALKGRYMNSGGQRPSIEKKHA
jgi:hypothetical protein